MCERDRRYLPTYMGGRNRERERERVWFINAGVYEREKVVTCIWNHENL